MRAVNRDVQQPRLVLVHGVGPVRDVVAERESWIRALIDGARKAGHSRVAHELSGRSNTTEVAFAHYADLFFPAQAQGASNRIPGMDSENEALAVAMLSELIREQQDQERPADIRSTLRRASARMSTTGESQGVGDIFRNAINAATTLLDVPYLRKFGTWVSGAELMGQLGQVGRYLSRHSFGDDEHSLDGAIRERLHILLRAGPTVVVAHSLGTVVAWEALHEREYEIPIFVTLGSPLSMRGVVLPRLRPQPPSVPIGVTRWLNVWDRDDLVAARPLLERDFQPNSIGVKPLSERVDSDGIWVHPALKYLAHPPLCQPYVRHPGDRGWLCRA